jgi:hypothetical protein
MHPSSQFPQFIPKTLDFILALNLPHKIIEKKIEILYISLEIDYCVLTGFLAIEYLTTNLNKED